MTLSDELKEQAVGLGLCQQWTEEWKDNSNKEELADKMIKGIDFCLKHNFPSSEQLDSMLTDDVRKKGIYCNEEVRKDDCDFAALFGNCNAWINVSEHPAEIYVRHTSVLRLSVENGAKVWVNCLDYAKVIIDCDAFSKVFVHNYGDCFIDAKSANVSVKHRQDFFGTERYSA